VDAAHLPRYGGRTGAEPTYAFDNARAVQRERLRTLETLLDSGTTRHLAARGIGRDWHCLEMGAGGGSIALWLAERAGSVVAADLDTTVLSGLSRPNLEVRAHDVMEDDLPEGEFDLVHLRLLLAWLPDPRQALRRLARALKPGGTLLAEEMDFVSVVPDPRMPGDTARTFARVAAAHNAVLAELHGFDPYYGRRLAGDVAEALSGVESEARATMWRGGGAGGAIWRLTLVQLRDEIVESGLATSAEVAEVVERSGDSEFSSLSPLVMAAWGRRG
jgi:ubiquinone/menaquinone biosynthesis C-methylase UbiE